MEQEAFLSALEKRLIEMEIPEQYRQQYLHQFARYFNTMTDDETVGSQLSEADPNAIALEIARAVNEAVTREDALSRDAEESSGIPSDLTADDPAADSVTSDADDAATRVMDAEPDCETRFDPLRADDIVSAMQLTDAPEPFEEEYLYDLPPAEGTSENEIPLYADEPLPYDAYFDEEKAPVTPLYVGVVILTSPIALTLYLTIFALFFTCFSALVALVAAFSVAVITLAGAGGAVSVFDLIYGISRFGQSSAIGFYEVGIAVMIAGATLFLTIVLFQFGLRFLPFVMRQLRRLLSHALALIRRLYRYLRKECAGG